MPIMPFSEPEHVPLLLSGRKMQTTRRPRKKPLAVGDILYCYYRPRQRPSCKNCVVRPCTHELEKTTTIPQLKIVDCSEWSNYFGEAVITSITKVRNFSENGAEPVFKEWQTEHLEEWAAADGFESFDQADKWFTARDSKFVWMLWDWDIITFKPGWIV